MPVELPVSLKEMNPAEKSRFAVHFFFVIFVIHVREESYGWIPLLNTALSPKLMWSWYLGNTNRVRELQEHKVRGGLLDG